MLCNRQTPSFEGSPATVYIHTYLLDPTPPPRKKKKSTRLNFPFRRLPFDKSKPFQGNEYWLTSSKAEAYPGKTSEKCTPPPPQRRPSGQSIGLAIRLPGSNPALATGWISSCSQSFSSSHPRPRLVKPTGCLLPVGVFNPVMLYLNSLFLNYLSGLPVN